MRAEHAPAAAQSRVRFDSRFINIECIAGPNRTRLYTALHWVPNHTSVKRDGDQMKGSRDVRITDEQTCFIVRLKKSRYIFLGQFSSKCIVNSLSFLCFWKRLNSKHQQHFEGTVNLDLSLVHQRTAVVRVCEVVMLKSTSLCPSAPSQFKPGMSFPPAAARQLPHRPAHTPAPCGFTAAPTCWASSCPHFL